MLYPESGSRSDKKMLFVIWYRTGTDALKMNFLLQLSAATSCLAAADDMSYFTFAAVCCDYWYRTTGSCLPAADEMSYFTVAAVCCD